MNPEGNALSSIPSGPEPLTALRMRIQTRFEMERSRLGVGALPDFCALDRGAPWGWLCSPTVIRAVQLTSTTMGILGVRSMSKYNRLGNATASEKRRGPRLGAYSLDLTDREALRLWRETSSLWDEAVTGIDMAELLDSRELEVAEAIRSTRAILERLRAKPYLERLQAAARASDEPRQALRA